MHLPWMRKYSLLNEIITEFSPLQIQITTRSIKNVDFKLYVTCTIQKMGRWGTDGLEMVLAYVP